MYENSVKVPFVMSHPGRIAEGKVSSAMASQHDFMPTLLYYLDLVPVVDDLSPGQSFHPVLSGDAGEAKDEVVVFDEYGPVRMIRNQEWKYVHRYPYGPNELYHLLNDPDERKNLVDEKSKTALIGEMRQQLSNWFDRYVIPQLDGSHFAVTGEARLEKSILISVVSDLFLSVDKEKIG